MPKQDERHEGDHKEQVSGIDSVGSWCSLVCVVMQLTRNEVSEWRDRRTQVAVGLTHLPMCRHLLFASHLLLSIAFCVSRLCDVIVGLSLSHFIPECAHDLAFRRREKIQLRTTNLKEVTEEVDRRVGVALIRKEMLVLVMDRTGRMNKGRRG